MRVYNIYINIYIYILYTYESSMPSYSTADLHTPASSLSRRYVEADPHNSGNECPAISQDLSLLQHSLRLVVPGK